MSKSIIQSLVVSFLATVLSACSWVIPTVFPLDNVPAPTGPYPVGSKILYWTDTARDEAFTQDVNDKRRLVVQIWYPTTPQTGETMNYILKADQRLGPLADQIGIYQLFIAEMENIKTNAYLNAPLAPSDSRNGRALLMFSHGLGGTRNQNTVQAEELASHGYVVISADHAYDAYLTIFEDGSTADYRSAAPGELTTEEFWAFRTPQLNTRTADLRFMLDTIASLQAEGDIFWQNVHATRVGAFGHSYGGATSIMAAARDERVAAVIALDGWTLPIPEATIDAGLHVPFLYLGQTSWTDPINYQKLDRLMAANQVVSRKRLLEGSRHSDFSDTPQFSPNAKRFNLIGEIPRERLREILNTEIRAFFDDHIRSPNKSLN